ncbi:MAG: hypothetical protein U1D26_01090, partial [Patescibacteria group bacterium]|nr:hypothetical protein [Patescibacteria group bacterium]
FGECMAKCAETRRLPDRMVLFAHPDMAQWLARFFARIDFTQFTRTTKPFEVKTLESADLARCVEPVAGISPDIGITIAGTLVNIEASA